MKINSYEIKTMRTKLDEMDTYINQFLPLSLGELSEIQLQDSVVYSEILVVLSRKFRDG